MEVRNVTNKFFCAACILIFLFAVVGCSSDNTETATPTDAVDVTDLDEPAQNETLETTVDIEVNLTNP